MRRIVIALILALAAFATRGVIAQPIELFEREAPPVTELYDAAAGRFAVPAGDWSGSLAWLRRGRRLPDDRPVMAILDSGVIASHPFIAPVLREALDLAGEGPEDRVGHGTFVTLISLLSRYT